MATYFPEAAGVGPYCLCGKYQSRACPGSDFPFVVGTCKRFHACTYCMGPHPVDDCPALDFLMDFEVLRYAAQFDPAVRAALAAAPAPQRPRAQYPAGGAGQGRRGRWA